MSIMRNLAVCPRSMAVVLVALSGVAVFAQQAEEAPADGNETIEEIMVIAPRPGARRRVDQEYEDPVRAKLLRDFYKMQEDQEEFAWRKTAAEESPTGIKWGYDPSDEYQMRKEMEMLELPSERTRPATLFRFNF